MCRDNLSAGETFQPVDHSLSAFLSDRKGVFRNLFRRRYFQAVFTQPDFAEHIFAVSEYLISFVFITSAEDITAFKVVQQGHRICDHR